MRSFGLIGLGFGLGLIVAAFATSDFAKPQANTEDEYSLIITLQDGNEYAAEYRVTREDCNARMRELFGGPIKGVECKREE